MSLDVDNWVDVLGFIFLMLGTVGAAAIPVFYRRGKIKTASTSLDEVISDHYERRHREIRDDLDHITQQLVVLRRMSTNFGSDVARTAVADIIDAIHRVETSIKDEIQSSKQ